MNKFPRFLSAAFALALLAGCASTVEVVDTRADNGPGTMGIDYRDFDNAAATAVQEMLDSGAVDHPRGGRYVLAISRMTNDTMQRIDTDQLVKKIRVALLRSGKVVTTTAVGLNGAEDEMVNRARELRQSREFKQETVAREGQMVAPDYSLSGKIIQRNHKLSDGRQQVEYYFQLTLTDINSGLAFWEGETPIVKRGSNKTVSW
ncbi:penicillin-binding protein activator LpoB [Alkalilimnicola sp. S0819]|uniref:penicillin-binding protein activator LpoB n=1 Tax=Alkalilimnicola sp. S0819 TaxID=2613922 RepID=UPI001261A2DD|nr:penicillin-binding protein activator LpoB [Alkalilimnicola sp. S0819]KAB7624116.1 penicillin-binding protein activator LpoB [Alkalilimnicola sp. S0819]MPQ16368.1 penicillin-binding protein activator LpoB [Alkalilimnicola sp. S0819]